MNMPVWKGLKNLPRSGWSGICSGAIIALLTLNGETLVTASSSYLYYFLSLLFSLTHKGDSTARILIPVANFTFAIIQRCLGLFTTAFLCLFRQCTAVFDTKIALSGGCEVVS